jgi:hypothetical protein
MDEMDEFDFNKHMIDLFLDRIAFNAVMSDSYNGKLFDIIKSQGCTKPSHIVRGFERLALIAGEAAKAAADPDFVARYFKVVE